MTQLAGIPAALQFPGQSQIRAGIVLSVTGQNPGPASQIFYTVAMNQVGDSVPTSQVETYAGVQPFNSRWPDEVDTVAAPPGEPILGLFVANKVYFLIPEQFRLSECPTNGGGGP